MPNPRTQRLRDPVHGLIAFRADNRLDQLAWSLQVRVRDIDEWMRQGW